MSPTTVKKRQRPRAAVNKVTASYRIADELWAVLQPLRLCRKVPVNGGE